LKRFYIVMPKDDGGMEVYAMKEWLRQNPQYVPTGLNATLNTSHQLRNGLRRQGWSVQETTSEVRLIPPGSTIPDFFNGDNDDDDPELSAASFGLEFQLRDFLAQNISAINVNGKRLNLYVDPTGRDGIEYPTAVGPIDILAVDDTGAFFVFELKRVRTPDRAIGQLTRYMGWVRETIGKDQKVNGIIIAKEISNGLRYAISVIPNVSLFEYEVDFRLKPAQNIQ